MAKIKRYVKTYVEEAYCDVCGHLMSHTGVMLTSNPAQYEFQCTNPECGNVVVFTEQEVPGPIRYEYDEFNSSELME